MIFVNKSKVHINLQEVRVWFDTLTNVIVLGKPNKYSSTKTVKKEFFPILYEQTSQCKLCLKKIAIKERLSTHTHTQIHTHVYTHTFTHTHVIQDKVMKDISYVLIYLRIVLKSVSQSVELEQHLILQKSGLLIRCCESTKHICLRK